MKGKPVDFESAFLALTGHQPLRWQKRLYQRLFAGDFPRLIDLPTGLGKTSIIPIWLIALAAQAERENISLPRRLIYIVNRRTVVDQATDVVASIRTRLSKQRVPVLEALMAALAKLAAFDGEVLAITTLRGELADNKEWKFDPARAAVIVGTVDMIGSKLLFSGYGDRRYSRAHHAGLIGQDALIVHDEAHLTPAFGEMLREIERVQQASGEPRPIAVVELTATARRNDSSEFGLLPEDLEDDVVRARLYASKRLKLHRTDKTGKEMAGVIAQLATAHEAEAAKVLVYVRSPEDAKAVDQLLRKRVANSGDRVAVLTGTMRGYERDQLVDGNPVFQGFLSPERKIEQTMYLVSTSAGEIGIDIDADHMVCDLTTLDSLIQRFGRVNRRGGGDRAAHVDIVVPAAGQQGKDTDYTRALQTTQQILSSWAHRGNNDLSPGALRELLSALDPHQKEEACAPQPRMLPLTDILLDAWSLTSIDDALPGRPDVSRYLHGIVSEPPQTTVCWRHEVIELDNAEVSDDVLTAWFRACRVLARERLSDRSDRVAEFLQKLRDMHTRAGWPDMPVVLMDPRGTATRSHLSDIAAKDFDLDYLTVVLPDTAGGLSSGGYLDATQLDSTQHMDVAEMPNDPEDIRERWLCLHETFGESYCRHLLTGERVDLAASRLRVRAEFALHGGHADEDVVNRELLLMMTAPATAEDEPERAPADVTLTRHADDAVGCIDAIASALWLSDFVQPLRAAMSLHDKGKNRAVWQRYARNRRFPDEIVGKSERYLHPRALGGYRHEFGSLLDALEQFAARTPEHCDLILHLVAAHHDWGRPHFRPQASDPPPRTTAENRSAAADVMRRFARVQQHYGRWGLAWLESLVRCADIAASRNEAVRTIEDAPATSVGVTT